MSPLPPISSPGKLGELPNNTKAQWWRDSGLRRLVFWQSCILISQMTVGYDESVTGSFQAMQPWRESMGNPASSDVGLITAIIFVGGYQLHDLCWAKSAERARAPANGRPNSVHGKSPALVALPRLLINTAQFNVLWYVGSLIAAWLTFGTGHLSTTWSWRIPSIFQGVPAAIVLLSTILMPESPRYLCSRGRTAEALHILSTYHANGDASDALVTHELQQITAALAASRSTVTWRAALRTPAHRARLAICVAVAILTLWTGQGVISYYFSPMLASVGITSTPAQTGINGGMHIWNFACALAGALLADRVGRRPLWLISFVGMIAANVPLVVASARYAEDGSKAAAYATVVLLFLYNAAFNVACNPLIYVYTAELLPYALRTKGLGVQIAVSQAAPAVNNYVNPIALEAIEYWFFVFYLRMLVAGTG
ncbi:hypothetical protein B0J12DRAFT_762143 [Macrophomina phaseolina]|uniref:Major facilitator superfamily (MFS) profile domain-containing protein n=1 Tax=Macrophomina phaseolina TaxID=35725 RepID=A0ABQ8G460_9PEZI|nr:hypothetical protein B0J12DRAFT_762143 [Macrophomina phaseolina]